MGKMTAKERFAEMMGNLDEAERFEILAHAQYLKDQGAGGPSPYKPEYAETAKQLAELGATDEEMADIFGVNVRTLYRWKNTKPEFCQALKLGKQACDDRVERSLYQQAIGGNTASTIFWLKNRRPSDWRDKREVAVTDHRTEGDIEKALADALERKFLNAKAIDVTEETKPEGE